MQPEINPAHIIRAQSLIKEAILDNKIKQPDEKLQPQLEHDLALLIKEGELTLKDIRGMFNTSDYAEKIHSTSMWVCENTKAVKISKADARVHKCGALFDSSGNFFPILAADAILARTPMFTHEKSRDIYAYEAGMYSRTGQGIVEDELCRVMGDEAIPERIKQVLLHIRERTLTKVKDIENNIDWVCLENGLFNIKTRELKPHDRSVIMLNKLPVEYDVNAKCSKFEAFMQEFVPEDYDRLALQEFFGYCLLRDQRFQKAFMLYGSGANGKTTMLEILIKMLGESSVSNIELQDLDRDQYAAANLEGKLANIFMDIGKKGMDECRAFKNVVEGSPVDVQNKFKDRFKLRAYAKMIFATNMLPEFKEDTEAVYRRWSIVNFTKTVDADKRVPDYYKIFFDEISGVFNWSLDGLDRLLKQGKFSNDFGTEYTRRKYMILSNPVRVFLESNIIADAQKFIKKRVLFEAIHAFCAEKKAPVPAENVVLRTLQSSFPYVEPARVGTRGDQIHVYKGITWLKEEGEAVEKIVNNQVVVEVKPAPSAREQSSVQDFEVFDFTERD
jgi:putative DNA primase/helicase